MFFRHEITKTARKEEAFPIKKRKFARNYKEYMGFFSDLIQYGYLSNALAACVLSGFTCGVFGTYVVCRRMVFLAGGITHASFGGLGIAFWMGANPIAGAMIFAVLSALGIEWAGSRGRIREDSAIGIIWSVGMAVGALFMSLRPGYTSGDLSAYLFGSIVTVTDSDVAALAALTAVIIAGALLWLRPVMYTAFDRDFARSRGIPTRVISYLMAALVAVTIVLSLRIMLLSLPFLWLNDLLARLYPSVQRQRLSVLLLTLQNVVLKILLLLLCVAAISRLHWRSVPAVAVWCLLVELLSPAVTLLREKQTCGNVALLGLEDQTDRSCHSFSITGKAENVADIHREIDLFCQQNGIPRNKGVLLAIAFEEAALNTINHNEHVSMIDICLLLEEGSLIVRIRDDGAPFDPLAFVDDEDILQMNTIRLLERLTDQKTYTRIMNMNNTVLSIRLEAAENDGANDGTC